MEYGPILMVIEAYSSGNALTEAAVAGGHKAIDLLNELTNYLPVAKKMLPLNLSHSYPRILNNMIETVKMLNEENYTPMAVVAGVISDMVKNEVIKNGAKTVIVNNGGDIAIEIEEGHNLKVGIIKDLTTRECNHIIRLSSSSKIKGIATSGFGGRSLSKGVADAVTVFASNCSLADAAATSIANATYCASSEIKRCKAEELDYQSDLKGFLVTCYVGTLDKASINKAINNGLKRAKQLFNEGMIYGSVIYLKNRVAMWPINIVQPRD